MSWFGDLRGKPVTETPAPPAGSSAPSPGDPPEVWVEAVCSASDKAAAAEWAAQVEGDEWLAAIAIRGRFAEVRLAAVQRITDAEVLKKVADANRDKDKLVYRHCSETLRAHRQGGERARRAPEFVAALQALLDATPLAISHLLQIEKDMQALGADGAEFAGCNDLLALARARVLEETQAQIDLRGLLSEAEAVLAGIVSLQTADEGAVGRLQASHAGFKVRFEACPAWLAALPAARSLKGVLQDMESRIAALGAEQERLSAQAALQAAQAAQAAEAAEAARQAQDEAQRSDDAAQGSPSDAPRSAGDPLQATDEGQTAACDTDAAKAAAHAKGSPAARKPIDKVLAQQMLDEFERHLEEGHLAEADAAALRLDNLLGGEALTGQLGRRLQRARSQVTRLHGWERWGTDQARAQLIGAAEALLRGEPDIAERARAVPLLRGEWKRLDAHGAASRGLWFRFDTALERAYKPVAKQRAADAARHEAARTAKRALLDTWGAWLAPPDGAAPDHAALGAKRAEMIAQWRAAESAGFRDERKLRKRFDALVEKIDAQLEQGQAAEVARREEIIVAAQALSEIADSGQAVNAAKALQRRWKEEAGAARIGHAKDRKLWERFRAACDAVFARREAEQAERAAQRNERAQAQKAVLDDFETVIAAAEAASNAGQLKQALAKFRAALPRPRPDAAGRGGEADPRARALIRRAEQKIDALQQKQQGARYARMAEESVAAAASATPEVLAQGHAARDELLLDLEIALDLPTPQSHAATRRARMLKKLQGHFRGDAAAAKDPDALVAQWYATPAAPDAAQDARLASVVDRLIERARSAKR